MGVLWKLRETERKDDTKVDALCCVGLDEVISTIISVYPVADMEPVSREEAGPVYVIMKAMSLQNLFFRACKYPDRRRLYK